ncbi:MAG: hypothetical protein ACK4V6_14890 [Microthrixaceae bacterium]
MVADDFDVREAVAADREMVSSLAESGAYAAMRHLALFGHEIAGAEQRDRVLERFGGASVELVVADGAPTGYLAAWEVMDLSDHFGVGVMEVGPLITGGDDRVGRRGVARALARALVDRVRTDEPVMLMWRIESDDLAALHSAEDVGFRCMETSLSWVNDLQRSHLNDPVSTEGLVLLDLTDGAAQSSDFFEPLRAGARMVMTLDHYHADPRLPDDLCDALYERRFERALRGEGADVAVIRLVDGEVFGAGFWRAERKLERYGVELAGSGYGFRVPGRAAGMSEGFTSFVCNNSLTGNRLMDWTTQATNFPQVNMTSRQRSIRMVRSSYMLHGWVE